MSAFGTKRTSRRAQPMSAFGGWYSNRRHSSMSKNKSQNNEMNGRDAKTGQFLLGHEPMGGRPRGSRALLGEKFLFDLRQEWESSGAEVLKRVARDRPADLLKVIASLLPKEIDIDQALTVNLKVLAERDFGQAFAFALKHIGSERQELIEVNGNATVD
jgi:hypothetical protein